MTQKNDGVECFLESGWASVNKFGEELCGDNVAVAYDGNELTMVLADGLGSGVKANILSILTSKILCTMIADNISIEECVETIIQSLPVCKERGVAYSTFAIINVNKQGLGKLIEFDTPQAIYYHNGKCCSFDRQEMIILEKKIYISTLNLVADDAIISMSDGVLYAGAGIILNLGWQRPQIIDYLDKAIKPNMTASGIATLLTSASNELYLGQPGDDTTVAVARVRNKQVVDIMVGPPIQKENDAFYVARFLEGKALKVVCGGTTAQIVAEYLGEEVKTKPCKLDLEIPPISQIKGIDLCTEGVLTLRKTLELSEQYLNPNFMQSKHYTADDGASMLAQTLFEKGTHINFFVGSSINAAHQNLPIETTMKLKIIEKLSANLKLMGKVVTVQYH